MKVRRNVSGPDTSAWPESDPGALTAVQRKTFVSRRHAVGLGTAGALGLLMEAYPSLALWIAEQIRAKRVSVDQVSTDDGLRLRVRSLTKLHLGFLDQCRT